MKIIYELDSNVKETIGKEKEVISKKKFLNSDFNILIENLENSHLEIKNLLEIFSLKLNSDKDLIDVYFEKEKIFKEKLESLEKTIECEKQVERNSKLIDLNLFKESQKNEILAKVNFPCSFTVLENRSMSIIFSFEAAKKQQSQV